MNVGNKYPPMLRTAGAPELSLCSIAADTEAAASSKLAYSEGGITDHFLATLLDITKETTVGSNVEQMKL